MTKEEEQFLAYAKAKLHDDAFMFDLVNKITGELLEFYHTSDRKTRLAKIYAKLEKGTREYGSPIYPPARVDQEIEEEEIDLVGWNLVKNFNENLKKNPHMI